MDYQSVQALKPNHFKRYVGVQPRTFKHMLKAFEAQSPPEQKAGRPPKLSLADQLMVALQYWREYRTYFHIAVNWKVAESTVCRIVHRVEKALMASGQFRLPGKKSLLKGFDPPDIVVMDVTETPIERPKRAQTQYYSGKKRKHTLKCQLIIAWETRQIICTFFGQGRRHDFHLFKASGVHFDEDTQSLQDSGYQGIKAFHSNSYTPRKKPKDGELTSLEKEYNRELSRLRIGIEHVNGRLKVFKILSERYRNRRRRYGLRCNLIAALYNYELALAA